MSLLLGGLIAGGIGLAKSVFGGVQASKAQKKMNNLLANRPNYQIPGAYQKALGIAQQRASGEMPGMDYYENLIGETTARATTSAERGAISSNVFQGSVLSSQDRELQALKELATMGAQWKTQQSQNLESAQNRMGDLQNLQFEYNKNQPWQMGMNMASDQRQAGMSNLFSGLGDVGQSVSNLVGTRYYLDAIKGLYPQNTNQTNAGNSFQMPSSYNPQDNLLNTLGGMAKGLNIKYPK